jgi:purine-nucleoside phosphorylase
MMEKLQAAADYIASKINVTPQFGIILGSGLGRVADQVESAVSIAFEDIPHFPVSTVEGHEGKMIVGTLNGTPVLVLQGRFHYYEGYSMDQVVFPVRCMLCLNIPNLIVTNAAGSVDPEYQPGDLMLIKDHIKFHCDSPLRGPNIDAFGPRFNDMSDPYTREIRDLALECAGHLDIPLKEGVYYYLAGPSYETASEVKAIKLLGADAVGMSTVPEVVVAVHGGMKVMGISCITNMATGIRDQPLGHDEVIKTGAGVQEKFMALLTSIIGEWAALGIRTARTDP